jgi:flagellin
MASFSVVTNVAASNAQANLYSTNIGLRQALTRVSSGFRINNSGDDAAGLAVANKYRSDVAIITQGIRNANDGLSHLQIKDSALDNISRVLDRLASLATQAAGSTTDSTTKTTLNAEFQSLIGEITRESAVAGLGSTGTFSVFVSSNGGDGIVSGTVNLVTTGASSLNLTGLNLTTDASGAVDRVKTAINTLGDVQGQVGALQNKLSYAISLAQSQSVNFRAAESRIRDANIAEESANLTRFSILNQSGIAALAQANQQTAAVLSLLR